jgi:SsrA-binding protein
MAKKVTKKPDSSIARNKKARFDYAIEERFEAGLVLDGWEVKALRAGRAQLTESYVLLRDGEAWLFGAHINPLLSASTHVQADPTRTRKLLLDWRRGRAKLSVGLAKGKTQRDKRATQRDRDWQRTRARLLKSR